MSKYNNIEDFKEYELYPALWDDVTRAFPDMNFKKKGNRWVSNKHIDGRDSHSSDQTFIASQKKHLIKDNADSRAYSLIDFEMMRTGADFITALKRLADVYGLELPLNDSEEYKKFKEIQDSREIILDQCKKALWSGTEGANEVLTYMRGRGWTDDQLKRADIGYIDESMLSRLPQSEQLAIRKANGEGVGFTHRLVMPYKNGSRIFGFKFRDIHYNKDVKGTVKYLNSIGLTKAKGFLGISVGVKDAVLVEGDLDAIHAQVSGFPNVVATAGGAAGEEQIKDAIRRGVKRFTLLFDNDDRGNDFTEASISTIERFGIPTYVAQFPEGVKDLDEYLKGHSREDLETIINGCEPVCVWNFKRSFSKYSEICDKQGGQLELKQREDFLKETESIVNADSTQIYDRELVFTLLKENASSLKLNVDDIQAWMDRAYFRKQAKSRSDSTNKAYQQIGELLKERKTDEALSLMESTAKDLGKKDKQSSYVKDFTPIAYSSFDDFISEIKEGLPTGFRFTQNGVSEELTLNPGLTFICGYRAHGKTSFLNNIALNEATKNITTKSGNKVLYFSYEVDKARLMLDLLSTYIKEPISQGVATSMLHYFKNRGEARYQGFAMGKGHTRNDIRPNGEPWRNFIDLKVETFKREYISNGSLLIVDKNYKAEELIRAISFYLSQNKVSLICIDYAQLLFSEDYTRQRTEEIKKIVNDLKDFSNSVGIPFVLAAQFNREVDSPISVDTKCIGEAGDIERIADTVIGLFNLKEFKPLPSSKAKEEKDSCKLLSQLMGETITEARRIEGKLFVRLLKRRYGNFPLDMVVDWEGRTKYITPNYPEALEIKEEQGELFNGEECPF